MATCLFLGRLPLAPGTWGSLAGLGAFFACRNLAPPIEWTLLVAAILVGTWAAHRYAEDRGLRDPGEVVVDEFCGMWLALAGAEPSLGVALLAFLLFRFLDIAKPPPIRQLERLPGGPGIMADDLMAGGVVHVLLVLLGLF